LLAAEQVEDEWPEYEMDSLFFSYKDYLPYEDNEELWSKGDYDVYEAMSDDLFQPTSICQAIPSPAVIPTTNPTNRTVANEVQTTRSTEKLTTGTISTASNTVQSSTIPTTNTTIKIATSETTKNSMGSSLIKKTKREVQTSNSIGKTTKGEVTTSTPTLASQVPTILTTVKPTTVETTKEQTDKSKAKTTMMVSEIKMTSSNTFKTITGEAYTTSNGVQSSCDCSKCNIVATTISSDESSTNNEEMQSERPVSGKSGKKKVTHKPYKETETTEPETEVETSKPETENEPSTIETEPPTTEATEDQETQAPKRKRPTSPSNTEIASITENEKTTTPQGIAKNKKSKTAKRNRTRNYNPNLFSNQTINLDEISSNGGQNHSTKQPSAKTVKPKNTTTVKGTNARSRSKNPPGINEGPLLLNVGKNNTKRNSTSKPHGILYWR